MIEIRTATIDDLPAITDIYNDAVLTSDATFDTRPQSVMERTAWFENHNDRNPVIVSLEDGLVTGWASLSKWSPRLAYENTAELSVYVRDGFRGKGIGRKLMASVLEKGRTAGLHAIISRIVAGNDESIRLHESFGFTHIGIMKEVGLKFGRLLDVVMMQLLFPSEEG